MSRLCATGCKALAKKIKRAQGQRPHLMRRDVVWQQFNGGKSRGWGNQQPAAEKGCLGRQDQQRILYKPAQVFNVTGRHTIVNDDWKRRKGRVLLQKLQFREEFRQPVSKGI